MRSDVVPERFIGTARSDMPAMAAPPSEFRFPSNVFLLISGSSNTSLFFLLFLFVHDFNIYHDEMS